MAGGGLNFTAAFPRPWGPTVNRPCCFLVEELLVQLLYSEIPQTEPMT